MKKLVLLVLVLGLVSTASATLSLNPASVAGNVDDGIQVVSDTALNGFGDLVYVVCPVAVGTLSDGKDLTGSDLSSIWDVTDATYSGFGMAAAIFTGDIAPGTWFTMDFTMGAGGLITMYGSDLSGNMDTNVVLDTISVVPEPMTFALLGLGGLFLRRKK